jgi:uncharacterized membrane protein YedE/YeeE
MKGFGAVLITLGLVLILWATLMDTTVQTEVPSTILSGGSLSDRVSNLQKMQAQMMLFHGGLGAFLAGIILAVGGMLEDAIGQARQAIGNTVEPAAATANAKRAAEPAREPTPEEVEQRLLQIKELNRQDRRAMVVYGLIFGLVLVVMTLLVVVK